MDIVWTVNTIKRENKYFAIRVPLMKGLIGARLAVLNIQHQHLFNNPKMFPRIKQLRLVQGHDWPGVSILRANGYKVMEITEYNAMYKDISKDVYDFALRGMFEIYSEFEYFKQDKLSIDKSYLFYYPSAIYFFVKRDNQNLATKIYTALLTLISNGEFVRILYQYPPHKKAMASANLKSREVIYLNNPVLPEATPLGNKNLWYQFGN